MDYPKSVPNVGLVNGKFIDENTVTGAVGSLIPAEWGNSITDEVLAVIRGAALEPAESQNDQLYQAIQKLVSEASALPVGVMVAFPVDSVPPGFLEVDGGVYSAATYPDLAAFLGTAFNKGNEGAGNFRLPESRGEFLRGWDHGRGVDAGRAVGSFQGHQTENHLHVSPVNDTASTLSLQEARGSNWPYGASTGVIAGTNTTSTGVSYTSVGEDQWLNTGPNIALGTGETRPRNLAVLWCIKAWNAPINQGNIDVAALAALATQATEIKQGTAKIATQAQTDTGTDDATIVTPKKLRWGFQIQKAANGYIVFPSWLGGLVLQWGSLTTNTSADSVVNYPIQFPTALLGIQSTAYIGGASSRDTNVMIRTDGGSRTTFSVGAFLTASRVNEAVFWWALGF